MIKNQLVSEALEVVKATHTEAEAAHIILNSLAILGAKKVQVQDFLDEASYASINKYKYPERLASFIQTTNEKSNEWKSLSFAKLALR